MHWPWVVEWEWREIGFTTMWQVIRFKSLFNLVLIRLKLSIICIIIVNREKPEPILHQSFYANEIQEDNLFFGITSPAASINRQHQEFFV